MQKETVKMYSLAIIDLSHKIRIYRCHGRSYPYTCPMKSSAVTEHPAHFAQGSNQVLNGHHESILTAWAAVTCHITVSDIEEKNVSSDISESVPAQRGVRLKKKYRMRLTESNEVKEQKHLNGVRVSR